MVTCVFAIILSVFACKQGNNKSPNSTSGKGTYNQYCIQCHGKGGGLGMSGAKDLSKTNLSLEEKIHIISNGKGGMMPYKDLLTRDEISAVAKFTEKFKQN